MAINLKKNKSSQPIEGNETGSLNIETQGLSQGQIIRKKFFAHKPA
ncbi:MAG: ABC transporter permease, partial [Micrococcales bacterium]|nr:ABC transporter permease [Micrococcales bacterium]